jgi:hypothetical protein
MSAWRHNPPLSAEPSDREQPRSVKLSIDTTVLPADPNLSSSLFLNLRESPWISR